MVVWPIAVLPRRIAGLSVGYGATGMMLVMLIRGDLYGFMFALCSMVVLGMVFGGPFDSIVDTLFRIRWRQVRFEGSCDVGFEKVEQTFKKHFYQGLELQAQCAAYIGGVRVVDLCGSAEGSNPTYDLDSVQYVFSTSKAITSIVVAMLVDQKRISYDTPIADVWPEFAQHGKSDITLAQLMRHEAGCALINPPIRIDALTTEGIKQGAVEAQLAAIVPSWPRGRGIRREYHAETRGLLVNEVVRRVDVKGRTVAEFVRDEIASPLGIADSIFVGAPPHLWHKVAPVVSFPFLWGVVHSFLPTLIGGLHHFNPLTYTMVHVLPIFGIRVISRESPSYAIDPKKPSGYPHHMFDLSRYNAPEARLAEVPSSNYHASARALARVGAAVSAAYNGRQLDGSSLLSQPGAQLAHQGCVVLPTFFHVTTCFNNSGLNVFKLPEGLFEMHGFVGWMGLGGSILLWHPELDMSFAYTCTGLEVAHAKCVRILDAFVHCAKELAAHNKRAS